MFKVIQNGMNRLAIEMSEKLHAEEMRIALDELVGKSKNIKKSKVQLIEFQF
jgi:hypothetical protein